MSFSWGVGGRAGSVAGGGGGGGGEGGSGGTSTTGFGGSSFGGFASFAASASPAMHVAPGWGSFASGTGHSGGGESKSSGGTGLVFGGGTGTGGVGTAMGGGAGRGGGGGSGTKSGLALGFGTMTTPTFSGGPPSLSSPARTSSLAPLLSSPATIPAPTSSAPPSFSSFSSFSGLSSARDLLVSDRRDESLPPRSMESGRPERFPVSAPGRASTLRGTRTRGGRAASGGGGGRRGAGAGVGGGASKKGAVGLCFESSEDTGGTVVASTGSSSRSIKAAASAALRSVLPFKASVVHHPLEMDPVYGIRIATHRFPKEHQYRMLTWLLSGINDPSFMERCVGALLHADMGIGKTLTASFLTWLFRAFTPLLKTYPYASRSNNSGLRVLIVVPCNLVMQWATEMIEYYGPRTQVLPIDIGQIHPKEWKWIRDEMPEEVFDTYDFVIMSYSSVANLAKLTRATAGMRKADDKKKFTVPPLVPGWERDMKHRKGLRRIFSMLWNCVIMDEAEFLVNPTSQTWEAMMAIHAQYRLALSGTPWRNRASDMYALMRVIGARRIVTMEGWDLESYRKLGLDQHKFSMSRKDAGVDKQLPAVKRYVRMVHLSREEQEFYDLLEDIRANRPLAEGQIVAIDLRKRQVCIAPTLTVMLTTDADPGEQIRAKSIRESASDMDADDGEGSLSSSSSSLGDDALLCVPPTSSSSGSATLEFTKEIFTFAKFATEDQLRRLISLTPWIRNFQGTSGIHSSKNEAVIRELKRIPKGDKCLVFSMFDKALQLLQARLVLEGMGASVMRFSSTFSAQERRDLVDRFKTDASVTIMLISYGCGARGLNLTVANWTIKMDPWFCPGLDDQSFARVYRLGQVKVCHDVHLHSHGTIEEDMVEIGQEKKVLEDEWLAQQRAAESAYASVLTTVREHEAKQKREAEGRQEGGSGSGGVEGKGSVDPVDIERELLNPLERLGIAEVSPSTHSGSAAPFLEGRPRGEGAGSSLAETSSGEEGAEGWVHVRGTTETMGDKTFRHEGGGGTSTHDTTHGTYGTHFTHGEMHSAASTVAPSPISSAAPLSSYPPGGLVFATLAPLPSPPPPPPPPPPQSSPPSPMVPMGPTTVAAPTYSFSHYATVMSTAAPMTTFSAPPPPPSYSMGQSFSSLGVPPTTTTSTLTSPSYPSWASFSKR